MTTGIEYRTGLCRRFIDALSGVEEVAEHPLSPPHGPIHGRVLDLRAVALFTLSENFKAEVVKLRTLAGEARFHCPSALREIGQRLMLASELAESVERSLWIVVRAEFPGVGQFCLHRDGASIAVCGEHAPAEVLRSANTPLVPFWRN